MKIEYGSQKWFWCILVLSDLIFSFQSDMKKRMKEMKCMNVLNRNEASAIISPFVVRIKSTRNLANSGLCIWSCLFSNGLHERSLHLMHEI